MSTEPEPDSHAGPPAPIRDPISTGSPSPPEAEPPILDAERVPRRPREQAPRPATVRVAWAVAIATDTVQWVLWPLFAAGAASPFDDVVDVVAAAILIRLLGWHWAFLPAFVAEIIPGANLVPTWTAAVFLATRKPVGGARSKET
jgi:hypothetical protein